jgi:hypothetical protein
MKTYQLCFRGGDNFDEDSFVLWVKTPGIPWIPLLLLDD